VRYCQSCILPDTRPGLEIGPDGVCSACRAHERKQTEVDWAERGRLFEELVERVRGLDRPYDCLIPVSGGKDSTWQTVKCLEAGLHPLAVTWKTPGRTELGRRNLENLISAGVDHIDFQVNPKVERRFMLTALERYGTTAIPMHLALFNIPLTVAARWDVPLVIWGEDSASEYEGKEGSVRFTQEWVRKHGAVHGTTAEDFVSDDLTAQDLTPYCGPSDLELEALGIEAVFLGWFFEWDPAETARVAAEHGFEVRDEGPKTGFYDYADIDDDFISIHHWLKWHKFGFTRSWDNLALEIRNGRITREQAIERLRAAGDERPSADIARFCEFAGIPESRFEELAEKWRSTDVWTQRDGTWVIEGFLIPDWKWS
jgi:N-acetyl sugar amidotransferase